MKDLLRSYLFWTYERGSFHYDVMVTLILIFLFLSPRLLNFRDRPPARNLVASEVLVKTDGPRHFIYQIGQEQVDRTNDPAELEESLQRSIAPISGDVVIDRYETVKDQRGRLQSYRVWAHR
ncbi:MAG TPA: hypothetical protein VGD59_09750 [Acidisarcina sp.]